MEPRNMLRNPPGNVALPGYNPNTGAYLTSTSSTPMVASGPLQPVSTLPSTSSSSSCCSSATIVPQSSPRAVIAAVTPLPPARFRCPVHMCNSNYSNLQGLTNHVQSAHLQSEEGKELIPSSFLQTYQRWVCCGQLIPLGKACRECHQQGPRLRFRRQPRAGELHQNVPSPEGETIAFSDFSPVSPSLLSKLDVLLSAQVGTLHHIPPACRKAAADSLASALRRLHDKKDAPSAWLVMSFPLLVLFPVARGGHRHNRQTTGVIMERLRRWNAGDFESLFQEFTSGSSLKRRQRNTMPSDELDLDPGVQRAVKAAVSEGALRKAATLLMENTPPCSNAATALQELHPQRSMPVVPVASGQTMSIEVECAAVIKACKAFPPGSTGGPSGLRPVHLSEMLKTDGDDANLGQALAEFCSDFLNGTLPAEARPWFCGARIIGIPKKPVGIRPIAVGEVLRRLAAKCLVQQFQAEVVEHLLPHQLGVGVPNATEIIAHAVRAWAAKATNDESLILIDFANAFNTVDRQKMLEAVSKDAPQFLPYANYCYGAPTPLIGQGFQLSSCEGTQQGDVCGPLFFAVTLQQLIRVTCPANPFAWDRFYLDDGTLCGKSSVVEEMFQSIQQRAPDYGLRVNVHKCKQWSPVQTLTSTVAPVVPCRSGVKVLGIPIGTKTFVVEETATVSAKLQRCLDRLALLGCSFSSFHILRSCLSACKVIHLLRALPFDLGEDLARETHVKLREALGHILGTPVSVQQWALACLSIKAGGFGLLDPEKVVGPAHVACFISTSLAVHSSGLTPCPVTHEFLRALSVLDASSHTHCCELRGLATIGLPFDSSLSAHSSFESWSKQHFWYESVMDFTSHLLSQTLPPRMRKMRELSSGAHAGLWLLSPSPEHPTSKWDSAEWQALLRWRLGISQDLPFKCEACGCSQDCMGDHTLCCTASGLYGRHNLLRDTLASDLRTMGFPCRTEVALPGTELVPADIFLPTLAEDSPTAVDVSVVHPLQPSHSAQATVAAGTSAEARAASKVVMYGEKCTARSWAYCAFVAETTGSWNQAAQRLVRKLSRAYSLRTGENQADAAFSMWISLSRALARSVGRQLVRARPQCGLEVAQASWTAMTEDSQRGPVGELGGIGTT
jgi:hypothetical protein